MAVQINQTKQVHTYNVYHLTHDKLYEPATCGHLDDMGKINKLQPYM